jgi:K+/H+ antiporter YhaU regulatory subunit KhtT
MEGLLLNRDTENAIRELREAIQEERDRQFDLRSDLEDKLGRRINDADKAIGEMAIWMTVVTVVAIAEAFALGLLWWFR